MTPPLRYHPFSLSLFLHLLCGGRGAKSQQLWSFFFFSLKGCWLWTQLGEINYRQWPCPSGTAPPDRVPIRPSPSTTTTYRITKEPAADQDRRKGHQPLEQNGFELQIEFQSLPAGRFLSFVSKPTVKEWLEALFCSWWRTRLSLNF